MLNFLGGVVLCLFVVFFFVLFSHTARDLTHSSLVTWKHNSLRSRCEHANEHHASKTRIELLFDTFQQSVVGKYVSRVFSPTVAASLNFQTIQQYHDPFAVEPIFDEPTVL